MRTGIWRCPVPVFSLGGVRSYHASIGMAPYEALYGHRCRSPLCWDDVGERRIIGPELLEDVEARVRVARQQLLTAQSRQKSYVCDHPDLRGGFDE